MFISATKVEINPKYPLQMGCGETADFISQNNGDLEANLLLLSSKSMKLLLISIDTLYAGSYIKKTLENYFQNQNLTINLFASHTHHAPQLDDTKVKFLLPDKEHLNYVVEALIKSVTELLIKSQSKISLQFEVFETKAPISRRLKRIIGGKERKIKFNTIFLGPREDVKISYSGEIIRVYSEATLVAIIWTMPCHPTSAPLIYGHTSHYPGFIRQKFREESGILELPVLFLQGFSGDLRPRSIPKLKMISLLGLRKFLLGEWFINFSVQDYALWIENIWEDIKATSRVMSVSELDKCIYYSSKIPIDCFFEAKESAVQEFEIIGLKFPGFILIGLSAEVVNEYVNKIRDLYTNESVITVGCVNNVVGYIPTQQMIQEGGYESIDSLGFFGLIKHTENFENKFLNKIEATIAEIDAKTSL